MDAWRCARPTPAGAVARKGVRSGNNTPDTPGSRRTIPVLRAAALALALLAASLPPDATAAAATTERWGVFEVALPGPSTGNPYADVRWSARFAQGNTAIEVPGFYDGDGMYRVRFMPERTGDWSYVTRSAAPDLDGREGHFTVTGPGPGNHGPVRVAHTFHFAHADGTPYRQVGTTCYAWTHQPEPLQDQTLRALADSPFNMIRFCVFPKRYSWNTNEPARYPFEGAPGRFDLARFRPGAGGRLCRAGATGVEPGGTAMEPGVAAARNDGSLGPT